MVYRDLFAMDIYYNVVLCESEFGDGTNEKLFNEIDDIYNNSMDKLPVFYSLDSAIEYVYHILDLPDNKYRYAQIDTIIINPVNDEVAFANPVWACEMTDQELVN